MRGADRYGCGVTKLGGIQRKAITAAQPLLARFTATGHIRWHRARVRPVPVAVYSVYRARNASHLMHLVRSAPAGSEFHFHALDDVAPELRIYTESSGRGARIPLLRALIDASAPAPGLDVMLIDDDAEFVRGSVGLFAGIARIAALDIAQPAHARASFGSFRSNQVDAPSTARLVRFIESGPVVLFARQAFDLLYPFPEDIQMGWGIDVWWSALQNPALRLGVIDATPVIHHGEVGIEYSNDAEQKILDRYLAEAGIDSAHALDTNVGLTWRPWQIRPKWL